MGNNIEKGKRFVSAVISRLSPGGIQDWLSVLLVFLTLMVAALSLEQAHWVSSSLSLIQTLIFAVLASYLMIILRLRNKVTFYWTLVLGLLVMIWKSSSTVQRAEGQWALNAWWHSIYISACF
jgi:glucan phosphoethanolaminetransferase (alkaline phosphatase superfamily)